MACFVRRRLVFRYLPRLVQLVWLLAGARLLVCMRVEEERKELSPEYHLLEAVPLPVRQLRLRWRLPSQYPSP